VADSVMDKIIEDLVKGASRNTRDNGGPGVNVVVSRENRGREEKLAFELPPAVMEALARPGVAGGLGGGIGGGLHSLLSDDGHPMRDVALGAGGGALGQLAMPHVMQAMQARTAALNSSYTDGVKAAAAAFGVKEAFLPALAAALPMVGSMLGGTAARAGVGALARGAGGKMLGGMAGKILPKMTGGIGGAATDMIGSMEGGAIGNKLAPQQQQQQPQQMMN
jgi:hypothetical protein